MRDLKPEELAHVYGAGGCGGGNGQDHKGGSDRGHKGGSNQRYSSRGHKGSNQRYSSRGRQASSCR